MKLLRRHKTVLLTLGIYWPVIFVLTHIPVPQVARESGMSDKTMHVMAYFMLTFLVWFAISPYQKVRWDKVKVWIVLALVVWYGAMDEYLQGFVGRSVDIRDFMADLFGVLLGLGVLSIFSFWSALLVVSSIFIFVISNLSSLLYLARFQPYHMDTLFHFTAYTAFTLIWIQYLDRRRNIPPSSGTLWLIISLLLPMSLLSLVKGAAPNFGKSVDWIDIATALFGICAAILTSYATLRRSGGKK